MSELRPIRPATIILNRLLWRFLYSYNNCIAKQSRVLKNPLATVILLIIREEGKLQMAFELLGWDNPYERFPAPAIPVGRLDGQLVAVYSGGEKHDDPIPEDAVYRHLTTEQIKMFKGFDRLRERLFASSEHVVTRYARCDEAIFFLKLLAEPSFCQDFPEMREILQGIVDGN